MWIEDTCVLCIHFNPHVLKWIGIELVHPKLKGKAKFPALLSFTRHFLKVYFFLYKFPKKAPYVPNAFDPNIYFKFLKSLYIYIVIKCVLLITKVICALSNPARRDPNKKPLRAQSLTIYLRPYNKV